MRACRVSREGPAFPSQLLLHHHHRVPPAATAQDLQPSAPQGAVALQPQPVPCLDRHSHVSLGGWCEVWEAVPVNLNTPQGEQV